MDVLPVLQKLAQSPVEDEALLAQLAAYLNNLLLHNFPVLVQLLYRVDVPEKKLKATLHEHPGKDAGVLIAHLLIERQREKAAARKQFRFPTEGSEEERW